VAATHPGQLRTRHEDAAQHELSRRAECEIVANLVINDDTVSVVMSGGEKFEALHRDLTVPRSAVTSFRAVPDALAEVSGFKVVGAGLPGALAVGSWHDGHGSTFAVCHGHRPGVVLDLMGQHYDRIVLTVENPDEVIAGLS
jgi:hypothetical protein